MFFSHSSRVGGSRYLASTPLAKAARSRYRQGRSSQRLLARGRRGGRLSLLRAQASFTASRRQTGVAARVVASAGVFPWDARGGGLLIRTTWGVLRVGWDVSGEPLARRLPGADALKIKVNHLEFISQSLTGGVHQCRSSKKEDFWGTFRGPFWQFGYDRLLVLLWCPLKLWYTTATSDARGVVRYQDSDSKVLTAPQQKTRTATEPKSAVRSIYLDHNRRPRWGRGLFAH